MKDKSDTSQGVMMSTFKFAHIRQQGQDMIIVPVEASFGSKSQTHQSEFVAAFQLAVNQAGLAGKAAAIWKSGRQIGFVAPQPWHPFFKSQGIYELVLANLNKTITL